MFEIKGKVALVTGAAKGIGLCIVTEILKNGAKGVALIDIDSENGEIELEKLAKEFSKERVIYINADVSERAQFEDAFEQTIKTFKQLDIVVNNAGIVQELQWERCVAVNFQGCVNGSLLALDKYLPETLGSSQGIILNISSVWGLIPFEYAPVYAGVKSAILGFSRAISGPNRRRNLDVKVLTVCPAVTMTSLLNVTANELPEDLLEPGFKALEQYPRQTPEELAQHIVTIMQNGENGSVWAVYGNKSESVQIPEYFTLPQPE